MIFIKKLSFIRVLRTSVFQIPFSFVLHSGSFKPFAIPAFAGMASFFTILIFSPKTNKYAKAGLIKINYLI